MIIIVLIIKNVNKNKILRQKNNFKDLAYKKREANYSIEKINYKLKYS